MDTTASVSGTGISEFIVADGGNREGREAVSPILVRGREAGNYRRGTLPWVRRWPISRGVMG